MTLEKPLMTVAELKIDLFRKLDSLEGEKLEEVYGILLNFMNAKIKPEEWNNLTIAQQEAIQLGLEQLEDGKGRNHSLVMNTVRERFLR